MKNISSTDANRDFSKLLREVSHGQEVQITSRGRPVAVMSPVNMRRAAPRAAAMQLLARLDAQAAAQASPAARDWLRDELYR